MITERMKKSLKNNQGMTMVTVMVAFTIMMICIAMFFQVAKLSNNMIQKADQTKKASEKVLSSYYLNQRSGDEVASKDKLELTGTSNNNTATIDLDFSLYEYTYADKPDSTVKIYSFGKHELPLAEIPKDGGN